MTNHRQKLRLNDIDFQDRSVLVRVDFNVPLDDGVIIDDSRIRLALPTIHHLLASQAKVILVTHVGRPSGFDDKLSTLPIAEHLSKLLGIRVKHALDCIGSEVEAIVSEMESGDVLLLENVRFYPQETDNDPVFAAKLAQLADIYINDAFGTAHRAHASTTGSHYPLSVVGQLMEREIDYLGGLLENPQRPFVAIIGGAKISDKIGVIDNLINTIDELLIGGGMAYTFLKALGHEIGNSIVEIDKIELATRLMQKAEGKGVNIHLPVDHVVGQDFSPNTSSQVVLRGEISEGWEGFDIGPQTVQDFGEVIKDAETVFWNGPVGVYEFDQFAVGTISLAKFIAQSGATSIIGGGDCVAAAQKAGVSDQISHISTGGGASLELMEGKELPGITTLTNKSEYPN